MDVPSFQKPLANIVSPLGKKANGNFRQDHPYLDDDLFEV